MIRVVLDTNVLYSAVLKSSGLEASIFNLVGAGVLIPCISDAILTEYEEVLSRPALKPHAKRVREVLALLALIAERVEPTVTATEALDPDDNRFLECAETAGAEFLITGNLKHYPKGKYKSTRIVNARQFLEALAAEK